MRFHPSTWVQLRGAAERCVVGSTMPGIESDGARFVEFAARETWWGRNRRGLRTRLPLARFRFAFCVTSHLERE